MQSVRSAVVGRTVDLSKIRTLMSSGALPDPILPHSQNQAWNEIESALHRGHVIVVERRTYDERAYTHAVSDSLPDHQPAISPLAPIEDDERSLLIVRCDPKLGDAPLEFTYLMRGLAGRPATLRITSATFPGGVVHERKLEPPETTDGSHDSTWDGIVTSGGTPQGQRLPPAYSPAKVEVIHDHIYRDSASFSIPIRRVTILQFEDLSFATDRSILLPNTRTPSSDDDQHRRDEIGGLEVIAAALKFAERNSHKQVLVAGHTDTAGSIEHNRALSEARAKNVAAYLRGDRIPWSQRCQDEYEIADFKAVHRWASLEFGWDTDPGELDNEWHTQARNARDEFRLRCNQLLGIELEQHVKQNTADWDAIFQLYDIALARRLNSDAEQLASMRARISFTTPAVLGCGEHWPAEAIGLDDHALESNRRVELLFFDPGEQPQLPGDPPGIELYGRKRYQPEYLPADPASAERSRDYEIWVEPRNHWITTSLRAAHYRLRGPIPDCPIERVGTSDDDGHVREGELAPGDYILEMQGSFAIVGARYAAICYVDDRPDVYQLPDVDRGDVLPNAPRIYAQAWSVVTKVTDADFIEGVEYETS